MPINVPDNLPAKEVLLYENVFVMDENRAFKQDIRPLNIAILNLMPEKKKTETQLLRMIANSPLQIYITLLRPSTHVSKTMGMEHLNAFYKTFNDIKHRKFDGLIITGAPIEHINFQDVTYWNELKMIMDWSIANVTSTMHICWGAQAGLYHHYGIPKHLMEEKMFGIFPHRVLKERTNILRGFDEQFYAPHSRHTTTRLEDVQKVKELDILCSSESAGIYLIGSKDNKQIFVTGHPEYDSFTMNDEYERDLEKGKRIKIPYNYYPNDDVLQKPVHTWRSHATLLFSNWLNYYVYQQTPYDWK